MGENFPKYSNVIIFTWFSTCRSLL